MKNEDNDGDHQAQENQEATCRIVVESTDFHSVSLLTMLILAAIQREVKTLWHFSWRQIKLLA